MCKNLFTNIQYYNKVIFYTKNIKIIKQNIIYGCFTMIQFHLNLY